MFIGRIVVENGSKKIKRFGYVLNLVFYIDICIEAIIWTMDLMGRIYGRFCC